MARTPENETITRDAETNAENQANQAVGQYQQNLGTLDKGGQVAANPWQSAGYLSNVNRLQSGALNSETNAGTNEIQQNNRRTGGLNSGATIGAIKDLSLQKGRLGAQLSSERASNDFGQNVNYQTQMAQAPLTPYSAAIGGVGATNSDLTKYGLASQQQTYAMENEGIKAAAAAALA